MDFGRAHLSLSWWSRGRGSSYFVLLQIQDSDVWRCVTFKPTAQHGSTRACCKLRRDVLCAATWFTSVLAKCVRNGSCCPLLLMPHQMGISVFWRSLHFPLAEGAATAASNQFGHSRKERWTSGSHREQEGINKEKHKEGKKGRKVNGRNTKCLRHHFSCLFVTFLLLFICLPLLLSSVFLLPAHRLNPQNGRKRKKRPVFEQSSLCLQVIRFRVSFPQHVIHAVDKHTHTRACTQRGSAAATAQRVLLKDKSNELTQETKIHMCCVWLCACVCLKPCACLKRGLGSTQAAVLESTEEWCYSILGLSKLSHRMLPKRRGSFPDPTLTSSHCKHTHAFCPIHAYSF